MTLQSANLEGVRFVWWRYGISRSCDEWMTLLLNLNKINFGNLSSHEHRNYQMKLFSKSADFFYFQNTKPDKKLKPIIELNRSGVSVFVFTFSHDTKWHHEQKQPTQNHKGKSHLFKVLIKHLVNNQKLNTFYTEKMDSILFVSRSINRLFSW
jgi:hypothetical protein